jgi:pilus assembly protein TadC
MFTVAVLGGTIGLVVSPVLGTVTAMAVRRQLLSAADPQPDERSVAFALDLVAGVLGGGAPPEVALSTVAAAAHDLGSADLVRAVAPLGKVGRLLELGADPELAWQSLASTAGYAPVATAGRRCASSGARLAGALAAVATDLRHQRHQAALARAERVGIWTLLPLGLCFLPAFICLGVVPVVAGVGGQMLSGIPS